METEPSAPVKLSEDCTLKQFNYELLRDSTTQLSYSWVPGSQKLSGRINMYSCFKFLSESESHSVLSDSLRPSGLVHRILQARILEWVAVPFPRGLPNAGIERRSPALQANSLPAEPPGKPKSLSLWVICCISIDN